MLRELKDNPASVDINTRDPEENNSTALHQAAQISQMDAVEGLLELGADINAQTWDGKTALHYALEQGRLGMVKHLLDHQASLNIADIRGYTSLHLAAQMGYTELVQAFLQKDVNIINAQDKLGYTPLHLAILDSKLETVKALIAQGAKIDMEAENGMTALHLAASRGYFTMCQELLDRGADKKAKTKDGKTPLALTTNRQIISLLQGTPPTKLDIDDTLIALVDNATYGFLANELRDLKSNPNKVATNASDPGFNRGTALHHAAKLGNQAIMEVLLAREADVNAEDANGQTPLCIAARQGNVEIVKMLLNYRANVYLPNSDVLTPLQLAADRGHLEVVKVLLQAGADINTSNDSMSPLYMAAEEKRLEVVKFLLEKGADVNFQSSFNKSVLYIAVAQGHTAIVKELLRHKTLVLDAPNFNGTTPLHLAAINGYLDIVQALVEAGANVSAKDKGGKTPFAVAKDPAIQAYLQSKIK